MGAKTSKSANITASPKKEPIVAEGENNHVNGVSENGPKDEIIKEANNAVTEVIENVKEVAEEVKEVVIEKVEELSNDLKDAAKGLLKTDETKTPTTEGEEKKKVKKSFSLRKKLSFLRREKKVKEDKHKNGDVATPEKKEETKEGDAAVTAEGGQGDAKPVDAKPEEIKEETKEEVKSEAEVPVLAAVAAEAEKVVEAAAEEIKAVVEPEFPKVPELPKVEEQNGLEDLSETLQKAMNITETATKEFAETVEKKFEKFETTVESTFSSVSNSAKESLSELIAITTNGHGDEKEEHAKEVAVAE